MSDQSTNLPNPEEPADAPNKRIRRGCVFIIGLLALVAGFNFVQYGLNVIVLVGAALLVLAIIGFVVIARDTA
jgi:hypothetical protein